MILTSSLWGKHANQDILLFTLSGKNTTLQVSNLGCSIVSWHVSGNYLSRNIVLGYDTPEEYLNDPYYLGSLVGRYAGRIAGAAFEIGGHRYSLAMNEQGTANHLHGGTHGFNKKIFTVMDAFSDEERAGVRLHYKSVDLEEGYPGNLDLIVTVSLNRFDELSIVYEANTDRPTCVNLTHHCYFNLGSGNALDQTLKINADRFLEYGQDYIPSGKINAVAGTSHDFTGERKISSDENGAAGYNDYFIFNNNSLQNAQAELLDPASRLRLQFNTTYPGLLLYTGDHLDHPFAKNAGVCLETQLYPDAPNHPEFPSALLHPGEKYHHETIVCVRNIR